MDILNIRRLAVIEKGPLLVEDQGQGGDQVRAKTDRPDKAILNPHRARAALLRQVDHVPRRFATPPCKIIPRSRAIVLRSKQSTTDFGKGLRSEEHTSELQSLMRISYAVFCLKN